MHAPTLQKKEKNICKVWRLTVNAKDKRDNIEKEKDIDVKENMAGEVGHNNETTEELRPSTVAAAR